MRLRFIIEGEYELPANEAVDMYGTTDPIEVAMQELRADPLELMDAAYALTVAVEPVDEDDG